MTQKETMGPCVSGDLCSLAGGAVLRLHGSVVVRVRKRCVVVQEVDVLGEGSAGGTGSRICYVRYADARAWGSHHLIGLHHRSVVGGNGFAGL